MLTFDRRQTVVRLFIALYLVASAGHIQVYAQAPGRADGSVDDIADAFSLGVRLNRRALTDLLSGATLYGKYVDGRPDWAEQTAVTGELYDVVRDWLEVGQWSIVGDGVCYSYFRPMSNIAPGTSCFDVYEYEEDYYFYSIGTPYLVGYTYRVDRPGLM